MQADIFKEIDALQREINSYKPLGAEFLQQIKEYIDFSLKTRQEDEIRLKELETIRIQNENYNEE